MKTLNILLALLITISVNTATNAATYADDMEWYEFNYNPAANETVAEDRSYIDEDRRRTNGSHSDVETMWYYWSGVPMFHDAGITGFVAEYNFYRGKKKVRAYAYSRKGETLLKGWDTVYATYSNGKMQPFAVNDGDSRIFSIYNPLHKGNNFTKAK